MSFDCLNKNDKNDLYGRRKVVKKFLKIVKYSLLHLLGLMSLPTKKVTALSEDLIHSTSNLIDQDTNTFYAPSGDTSSVNEWVQIELLNGGKVHEVRITNPVNCCDNKLTTIEVRVGDNEVTDAQTHTLINNQVCGTYSGAQNNGDVIKIQCNPALEGKYATIQTLGGTNKAINMAEAELLGTFDGKKYIKKVFI